VLSIINAQVYINGKPAPNAPKQQTSYNVVTNGVTINPDVLQEQMYNYTKPTVGKYL